MAADAAHPAAAQRAGAAEEDAGVVGLDAPAAALLGPRELQLAVEDVATGHGELALDVERGLGLEREDAIADRLVLVLVERVEVALDHGVPGTVVVLLEEARGRKEAEQGQRLLGRRSAGAEDRAVRERVAVELGRRLAREPAG